MIIHIMADGTIRKDITDHVVTNQQVYDLIDQINQKGSK